MAKKVYKMFIDEEDQESGVFAISLVENPAIESNWIYLSKHYKIELATANTDKQLLIGPVLIPNKEIPRIDQETGEEYSIVFDEDVIEKAAQLFLQRQYNNSSTLEHNAPLEDISFVESWIVADPKADKTNAYGLEYPKGTWVVMAKVNNKDIWADYVKTGKVKGFSLEGLFGHNLVEASKQTHLVSLSDLVDIFDTEYAEELLASIKGIIKKDGRMKDGKYLEMETYSDYPDTVKNAAQRGIDLNAKVNNKCATEVGKIRAQQLANGRNISVQTIKRMYAYTSRAREFYNPDDTTACGTISYLLWGGDAANRWSAAKLKELGLFNLAKQELETAVSVTSSYTGQFGDGSKHGKKPKYSNYITPALLAGEKVSFDYHETLTVPEIMDEAEEKVFEGYDVYVISAAQDKETLLPLATRLGIKPENVFATGSNKAKIEKIQELGITKHYDNNADVIAKLDELGIGNELVEMAGLEDACWEGYEAIGTKDLDGREVPNCVPIKE